MLLCFEHPIFLWLELCFQPGVPESCIQITLFRPFILRLVLLLLLNVSHPHFERACSARQPDMGLKSFFCATYHANSWSNCVRIANVCEKTRENPSGSK